MSSSQTPFDKQPSAVFLLTAESFYDCARLFYATAHEPELLKYIPGHKGYSRTPVYANCCRSLELILKGYLRAIGKTTQELRKLGGKNGHCLAQLHEEWVRNGMPSLTLTKEERQSLEELSRRHSEKEFEYPDTDLHRGSPPLEDALLFTRRAIDAARAISNKDGWRHHNSKTAEPGYREKRLRKALPGISHAAKSD